MRYRLFLLACLFGPLLFSGCGGNSETTDSEIEPGGGSTTADNILVVNTTIDSLTPVAGQLTLREAVANAEAGDTITFAPELNNQIIQLDIIGAEHSSLKGEVFTFIGSGFRFDGFQLRDYGKSALYAQKDLIIDASNLPDGVTINWNGGTERARVLAVYGDLEMKNVTVTSGYAEAEATGESSQPYTLGRGGAIAVWGLATLSDCTFSGNTAAGDIDLTAPTRDRGAFGGAIYANGLIMDSCIVAGNAVTGFGAAGGGIYSVGGADGLNAGSSLTRSSISGNRVEGQHAYGGGVYSDGGGPGNLYDLNIENCTISNNLVTDHPGLSQNAMFQYFYRGGGVYMSNGHLSIASSTIVGNQVTGETYTFSDKLGLDRPNMGGGGVAATIGDAHVVEDITIWHSIIAGNTVQGVADDLFSGSLLHFFSGGYNLVGTINFDFMLAPIPPWNSLSRKHWPKAGDQFGVLVDDALLLSGAERHDTIVSVGADAGQKTVLWYPPKESGPADDVIPNSSYSVDYTLITDRDFSYGTPNDLLQNVLDKLQASYGASWAGDIQTVMGDPANILFYGPPVTWPSNPKNTEWVAFWRDLDAYMAGKGAPLGPQGIAEEFWGTMLTGVTSTTVDLVASEAELGLISAAESDQLGTPRPIGIMADIGALEID